MGLPHQNIGNYSAAIHQDGEKPVLFVPYFFRELLGVLLNWQKQGQTEQLQILNLGKTKYY
jgi:hypothetical protein